MANQQINTIAIADKNMTPMVKLPISNLRKGISILLDCWVLIADLGNGKIISLPLNPTFDDVIVTVEVLLVVVDWLRFFSKIKGKTDPKQTNERAKIVRTI